MFSKINTPDRPTRPSKKGDRREPVSPACACARECFACDCVCLVGFRSSRIGNPTAVLLHRLSLSESGRVVVDVHELLNVLHYDVNVQVGSPAFNCHDVPECF